MHGGRGRRGKKQGRNAAPQNVLSVGDVPPGTFAVIDPGSKTLFVPLEAMHDTRAVHREGVPSLCRIFLEGRCRQGANCYQAHAERDVIMQLRAAALAEPTCCRRHGAPSDETGVPTGVTISLKNDDGDIVCQGIGLDGVCVTNGLRSLAGAQNISSQPWAGSELVVPIASLCRLHAGKDGAPCCRFEDKCNFVHLCRELLPGVQCEGRASQPPPPVRRPSPVQLPQQEGTGRHTNGQMASSSGGSPGLPNFGELHTPLNTNNGMRPFVNVPLSASAVAGGTPPIRFDPLALAATAPTGPDSAMPLAMSPVMVRSFSSTPSGLVWRHNPYGSSRTSSVVET